jgi:hypothetical protein
MPELKPITAEAIPASLEKALRYRMLNEPEQAESICEDVLRVDPANQDALRTLILALTDRFAGPRPASPDQARSLLLRLAGEYEREYYAGIIWEREGIAWLRSDKPRGGAAAHECLTRAMACFERAERLKPPANDDAVLRWNSCARMIAGNPDVAPGEDVIEIAATMGE